MKHGSLKQTDCAFDEAPSEMQSATNHFLSFAYKKMAK